MRVGLDVVVCALQVDENIMMVTHSAQDIVVHQIDSQYFGIQDEVDEEVDAADLEVVSLIEISENIDVLCNSMFIFTVPS